MPGAVAGDGSARPPDRRVRARLRRASTRARDRAGCDRRCVEAPPRAAATTRRSSTPSLADPEALARAAGPTRRWHAPRRRSRAVATISRTRRGRADVRRSSPTPGRPRRSGARHGLADARGRPPPRPGRSRHRRCRSSCGRRLPTTSASRRRGGCAPTRPRWPRSARPGPPDRQPDSPPQLLTARGTRRWRSATRPLGRRWREAGHPIAMLGGRRGARPAPRQLAPASRRSPDARRSVDDAYGPVRYPTASRRPLDRRRRGHGLHGRSAPEDGAVARRRARRRSGHPRDRPPVTTRQRDARPRGPA